MEGDCGYWKGIVGKKGRKRRDLGGGLGSWKGQVLGTGRGLWVLEGVDYGDGVRQLVAEQPRLGGGKRGEKGRIWGEKGRIWG